MLTWPYSALPCLVLYHFTLQDGVLWYCAVHLTSCFVQALSVHAVCTVISHTEENKSAPYGAV